MTKEQLIEVQRLLAVNTWWDEERLHVAAGDWYDRHFTEAERIKPSQWEQARQVGRQSGRQAQTYEQYRQSWSSFLWREPDSGESRIVDARGRERIAYDPAREHANSQAGVVLRYPGLWGQSGFADALFSAIETASQLEKLGRGQAAQRIIERLPLQAERDHETSLLRLRQAQAFVDLLVTRLKAEHALRGI